jgi:hypothetical protein
MWWFSSFEDSSDMVFLIYETDKIAESTTVSWARSYHVNWLQGFVVFDGVVWRKQEKKDEQREDSTKGNLLSSQWYQKELMIFLATEEKGLYSSSYSQFLQALWKE